MSLKFRNKSGKIYDTGICEKNLNILAHAQVIDLNIGSQCGGHGLCGSDVILILKKDQKYFSPETEKEKKHLDSDKRKTGFRLACQVFPDQNDLDLVIDFISS